MAFCLSSKVNVYKIKYFFNCIQISTQIHIQTAVFMSNDAQFFYNAWETIFGSIECRLLCSWHVDRAGPSHLNTILHDKRALVYKALKSITYELNESTFQKLHEEFLEELQKDKSLESVFKYYSSIIEIE